jgi:mRNA-degrading endonuclease RelE of RelBE toxin-antitoxin system
MKIKDQAIRELEELKPGDLLKVHDLILSLKRRPEEGKRKSGLSPYKRVRQALKQCKGSLSEDIMATREDRI